MRIRFNPLAFAVAGVAAFAAAAANSQTVLLEPFVVTATRGTEAASAIPASVRIMDGEELARTPALTLDGALRSVPGFSLFRRSDSLSAHPTTQGVSLRGLGPSGASRTLVLLDGVPVNDPFGGWVSWSKLPRLSLDRVELLRGGGATAWGNAALGGVVQLVSAPPQPRTARVQVAGGSRSLGSAELVAAEETRIGVVEIAGRAFTTDGFEVVAPENRGAVDIPASQRHRWLAARLLAKAGADTEVIATARVFRENRGNGTPLQNNRSSDALGSVVVNHLPAAGVQWTATAFIQDQEFSSTFSSVNATRTAETPASDQFYVPSNAWGIAWVATLDSARGGTTTTGFDFRSVKGETNEDSSFSNGAFTRRRVAGGEQQIGGVFALHSLKFSDSFHIVGGLRADRWSDTDGFRRESLIESGAVTRDDEYSNRDDWEWSPSVGIIWSATEELRVRASAQRAFRRPTLNELYRPFRVGAFVTEANPELRTETVDTVEAGVEWSRGPLAASATIFHHDLRDAVANVTLVHGPGTFPDFGFIPAGGAGRRRLDLDRVVVQGAELSAKVSLGSSATLVAEYLFSDARVRRGDPDPSLNGKALAQVPRHSATLSIEWRGPVGLTVAPRLRAFSRQFEDDENLLSLAGGFVGDVLVSIPLRDSTVLFLLAENVGDARVETGRSTTGVINTGTPRTVLVGVRADF
ncbi:MAG TPA: TonB-dependent receptor [Opitutaceae bacterium]|nr:TonB-dependent receptor [Opitutaceae bacterium]